MAITKKSQELVDCDTCGGGGEVHSHNPICWTCHGRGKIPKSEHDLRVKQAIEAEREQTDRQTVDDNWYIMTKNEKAKVLAIAKKAMARYDKKHPITANVDNDGYF